MKNNLVQAVELYKCHGDELRKGECERALGGSR